MRRHVLFQWIGVFVTAVGIVLVCSFNSIISYILRRKLTLSPTSPLYEPWRKSPVKVVLDAYLFNYTNPDQLLEENYRPEVVQLGPYRFNEVDYKVDIEWNENDTVTYRKVRRWYFDPEHSNGSVNDYVTMINGMPMAASSISRYWNDVLLYPLSGALNMFYKNIWLTKLVSEVLLDGYTDPLLSIASTLPGLSSIQLPTDRVSVLSFRNDSAAYDGVFNMATGKDGVTRLGRILNWNYRNRTPHYGGECGDIRGFSGEFFEPGLTKDSTLEGFFSEFCRSVQFEYFDDATVHGIAGYRYVMSKKTFDNGTSDPDTLCNCAGDCLPQGVFNTTSCQQGAPAFMSYPHFFEADPFYTSQISGLEPEVYRNRFYITVEPITGIPLEYVVPVQLNLLLQPNPKLRLFARVPTIMFPVVWLESRGTFTAELAETLRMYLQLRTATFFCSVTVLLSGVLILGLTFLPRTVRLMLKVNHLPGRERIDGSGTDEDRTEERKSPEENTLLHFKQ